MKEIKTSCFSKNDFSNKKDLIGTGSNGNRVYKIKSIKDNKKIFITSPHKGKYQNEISILQKISHPNIIKYYESYIQNGKLYLILEYAEGGDLRKIISQAKLIQKPLSQKEILYYFQQIASSIDYIHSINILHRDIKPENIFLSNGIIKLGDFDISKQLETENDFTQTEVGTPYYISPEICKGEIYNHKSDIWSLGCLIYELCSFERPFVSNSMKVLMDNITNTEPKALNEKIYSNDLILLIKSMMHKNSIKRPDIKEVIRILKGLKEKTYDSSTLLNTEVKQQQVLSNISPSLCISPIKSNHQRTMTSTSAIKFQSKLFSESIATKTKINKPFIKPEINLNYVNEMQLTNDSNSSLQSSETTMTINSMLSPLNDGVSVMDSISKHYIRQDHLYESGQGSLQEGSIDIQKEEDTEKDKEKDKRNNINIQFFCNTNDIDFCGNKGNSQPISNKSIRKELLNSLLIKQYGIEKIEVMLLLLKESNINPNSKEQLIEMLGKENYAKNVKYLQYILTH